MHRAYMQFWSKALSQYEEEAQRLMQITQGVMDDAAHVAEETIEAGDAHRGSNGSMRS